MGSSVQTELKLGDIEIEETDSYKYLGEIINNKGNLEDHIKMLEGNVEAAYQTILHIAKDKNFKGLKMAIIWKLVETCIIPIITYGAESRTTTPHKSQKIQTIMNNIIKRILQVPQSTPNDAITIETGIPNIQTITEIKQLNSHMRINKMDQNREIKQTWNNSKRWKQHINKINKKYNINISEIDTKKMSKRWKQEYLKVKILKTEIDNRYIEKTKYLLKGTNKWEPGKRAQYLELLTRKECNAIFSARTRMMNVNGNYHNRNTDPTCRACGNKTETQEHILEECPALMDDKKEKITATDIFETEIGKLKSTANKIMKKLEKFNIITQQ